MVIPFAEEDIYAYYLLHATWVDCVAYLGAVLFLLPCQHIFEAACCPQSTNFPPKSVENTLAL